MCHGQRRRTRRPSRPGVTRLGGVALALLAAGCFSGDEPESRDGASVQATRAAPAPLDPGSIQIEWREDGVRLRCREASREAVLRRLSEHLGFELALGRLPVRVLTLELEAVSPANVVAAALPDVAYVLRYELDDRTGESFLAGLAAGDGVTAATAAPPAREAGRPEPRPATARDIAGAIGRALADGVTRLDAPRTAEPGRAPDDREDLLARLTDPDPEVRAEAVASLEPAGEDLEQLGELARSDPDATVRKAAVAQLGDGTSYGAIESLLAALADPEPAVVLEALDQLAFQDDPTLARHVTPLRSHADPSVRAAAEETLEFLEF